MWPSRRSLHGQRNRGRGGEGPKLPIFFFLPSHPLPFPDVFYESLFFRIKMVSALKRLRTVALSVERVLESLEQKGDGNDGMSSGEESDLYHQLQETGDIYRSRYKVSCVTVLLCKLAHNAFHFQIILLSSSGHSIYNSDELIPLEFINFNRNSILLPREAFSVSKLSTLKLYAMNRREET